MKSESDSRLILFTVEKSVARLTLNRPDVLNSFNRVMAVEFQKALDECAADKKIRALYITGAGRAFCAGQDLLEAVSLDADIAEIVRHTYNPIVTRIRNIEKPVICAVNGIAAGAGANIAFACDIAFAAKSAFFIQSFANIGLIPDSGGTYFLPRLVGMQRAAALAMLGERVSAEKAEEFGLIWKAMPDEDLHGEGLATAEKLAAMPTKGLGLTKRCFNQGLTGSLIEHLRFEEKSQADAANSHDYREGVNAFLEKRKPVFRGE